MFSNSFQSGFISIFYSVGSNPLSLWDKQVKNGHIRRVIDDEVKSLVLEISGTNVATTYITSPIKPRASLGIKLPFLVMIIKNMKKYFTFEIQILDDKDMHRRFRVSNFQSTTKVRPFCTTMPIGLSSGWNQVQFNLADFTKRAYGSTYLETMRVQVHANVRIRRLYFTDTLYSDEDMPNEFKLFGPVTQKKKSDQKSSKDQEKDQPPKTDEKADEEIPPPPSPAEPAPEKETLETEVIDEQAHPSEVGEAPPEGSVEPAEQETVEGEAEKDKEVPPEGEEILQKDEATEEIKITEQQEVTEEVSVVVETEEKHLEETTEEMPPAEGAAPTEDAPPTEEAPPTEAAPPTEEPSPTEEPAPTEEAPSTEQPPTTQEPEAAAAVAQDPGTTEPASEVTTAEPAGSDVATTEPTVDEPTTSELPTESENESPEE